MSRGVALLFIALVLAAAGIAIGKYSQVEGTPRVSFLEQNEASAEDEALSAPQALVPLGPQADPGGSPVAEVEISFGDGTKVPVQLKSITVVHPPYRRAPRLLDQYDELARMAADGDALAARMLYRALQWCGVVRADHEAGEDLLRYCDGISDEYLHGAPIWAEMAAAGGDYLGIQDWAHELGSTDEGFAVWETYWESGNISALPSIAHAYQNGIPAPAGGQPDHLRAYAYQLIYFRIQEAISAVDAEVTGVSRRLGRIVALEDYQRSLGAMLNPQQQEEAEALAADLLRQNDNCCIGTF